jgi:hypothetical protein
MSCPAEAGSPFFAKLQSIFARYGKRGLHRGETSGIGFHDSGPLPFFELVIARISSRAN